jgi:CRP/FNR family cyclic AMP-dependent transcriptional regulator
MGLVCLCFLWWRATWKIAMAHTLFLLGELSDQDVDWMVETGQREQIDAGTVLIREGEPVTTLYVLLDGLLEISVRGDNQRLATLGRGEVVGEMSFVDARPPSATVRAAEDSVVLSVPRAELTKKLHRESDFAARFYRAIAISLSHRLREMDSSLAGSQAELESDELDPNVLDTIHLAGLRFERVVKRLIGGEP